MRRLVKSKGQTINNPGPAINQNGNASVLNDAGASDGIDKGLHVSVSRNKSDFRRWLYLCLALHEYSRLAVRASPRESSQSKDRITIRVCPVDEAAAVRPKQMHALKWHQVWQRQKERQWSLPLNCKSRSLFGPQPPLDLLRFVTPVD